MVNQMAVFWQLWLSLVLFRRDLNFLYTSYIFYIYVEVVWNWVSEERLFRINFNYISDGF